MMDGLRGEKDKQGDCDVCVLLVSQEDYKKISSSVVMTCDACKLADRLSHQSKCHHESRFKKEPDKN